MMKKIMTMMMMMTMRMMRTKMMKMKGMVIVLVMVLRRFAGGRVLTDMLIFKPLSVDWSVAGANIPAVAFMAQAGVPARELAHMWYQN